MISSLCTLEGATISSSIHGRPNLGSSSVKSGPREGGLGEGMANKGSPKVGLAEGLMGMGVDTTAGNCPDWPGKKDELCLRGMATLFFFSLSSWRGDRGGVRCGQAVSKGWEYGWRKIDWFSFVIRTPIFFNPTKVICVPAFATTYVTNIC